MTINFKTFSLGPLENNCYLLWSEETRDATVIDPTYDIQIVKEEILARNLSLNELWITHAHFDHVIGAPILLKQINPPPKIGLHPLDLDLWRTDAGAASFNLHISLPKDPDFFFANHEMHHLGDDEIEIRHVPGHTPGHVIFYVPKNKIVFCGDVIFYHSIGRTDLPGGDMNMLLAGIRSNILTLPADTRLLCGHGPDTLVEEELRNNPFLQ